MAWCIFNCPNLAIKMGLCDFMTEHSPPIRHFPEARDGLAVVFLWPDDIPWEERPDFLRTDGVAQCIVQLLP